MQTSLIAVAQLNSRDDVQANLSEVCRFIDQAGEKGVEWLSFPENSLFLSCNSDICPPPLYPQSEPLDRIRELSAKWGMTVLLGGVGERSNRSEKVFNTSVVIYPDDRPDITYQKCHLFDIQLPGREEHMESLRIEAGNTLINAPISGFEVGLSVCYDLRFPEMYRALVKDGATVLSIPAAFTSTTGRDHWEILLRARAIENQCYVIAPAQWGWHGGKRKSHGRSMIIDPWGTILSQAGDGTGLIYAELNPAVISILRSEMPALRHRRF